MIGMDTDNDCNDEGNCLITHPYTSSGIKFHTVTITSKLYNTNSLVSFLFLELDLGTTIMKLKIIKICLLLVSGCIITIFTIHMCEI